MKNSNIIGTLALAIAADTASDSDKKIAALTEAYANLEAENARLRAGTENSLNDSERAIVRRVVDYFIQKEGVRADAPGHTHQVTGVWDLSNHPEIAGKPCEWCALWKSFKAIARQPATSGETSPAAHNTPPDLSTCPGCGGPADNGHDREYPPNPYHCSKCNASDESPAQPQPHSASPALYEYCQWQGGANWSAWHPLNVNNDAEADEWADGRDTVKWRRAV